MAGEASLPCLGRSFDPDAIDYPARADGAPVQWMELVGTHITIAKHPAQATRRLRIRLVISR